MRTTKKTSKNEEKGDLLVFTCFFSKRKIQHEPLLLQHRKHFSNCVKIMTKKQVDILSHP